MSKIFVVWSQILCLVYHIFTAHPFRMRLCFSITDGEVERARNVFLTSLLMHLDGECVQL